MGFRVDRRFRGARSAVVVCGLSLCAPPVIELRGTVVEQCPGQNPTFYGLLAET